MIIKAIYLVALQREIGIILLQYAYLSFVKENRAYFEMGPKASMKPLQF